MITKEEREELAGLLEKAKVYPLPWEAHGDGYGDNLIFSADENQEDHVAEFTGAHSCDLAVAAVNAAPRLLAALEAAEARIAELESKEASAIGHALDFATEADEVPRLKARIAELEAAAAWKPIEGAPEGPDLLVSDGSGVALGDCYRGMWNTSLPSGGNPTHYRELPESPKGGA